MVDIQGIIGCVFQRVLIEIVDSGIAECERIAGVYRLGGHTEVV
jgi:hypothetical protein